MHDLHDAVSKLPAAVQTTVPAEHASRVDTVMGNPEVDIAAVVHGVTQG